MTSAKILINATLSDPDAKWLGLDLKDFYLNTPMKCKEYIHIPLRLIPREIIDQYQLESFKEPDGHVYFEVSKGMYGLPQAGIIAYKQLKQHLKPHGYKPSRHTPGLWTHITKPIRFCLVIDDFGVKYRSVADAHHLIKALQEKYKLSIDWDGRIFCGISLTWDYKNQTCDLNIPGYTMKALHKLGHPKPKKPQDAPHPWVEPAYGKKLQYADKDTSPVLPLKDIRWIEKATRCFLFYSRAVDPTMATALNSIASDQAAPTKQTMQRTKHFLDYCWTHPDATIRYHASDMHLWVHSDVAYLVAPKARSRLAGHFFLSDKPTHPNKPQHNPKPNGLLHTECKLIKHVVTSSTEGEIAATYHNSQVAVDFRQRLADAGYKQTAPTPIKTDNENTASFVEGTLKQRFTKHMDMRYHWLQDRQQQKQIQIHWAPGNENMADYHTKHHHPIYHRRIRAKYVTANARVNALLNIKALLCDKNKHKTTPLSSSSRGCINLTGRLSQSDTGFKANANGHIFHRQAIHRSIDHKL